MGLESIQAVQARMAAIEARFTATSAPPTPDVPPVGDASFAAMLDHASTTASGPAAPLAAGPHLLSPVSVQGRAGGVLGSGAVTAPDAHGASRVQGVDHHGHVHTGGRVQPPPELEAYGNGRIPAEALAPIGVGNHRLYAPAAASFRQMVADARLDGVTIGITDSYRSYEAQVDLAERKGLYRNGGLAATPGTSNHGWGLSVDLDLDDRAQAWMRANGHQYGFVEDVPREPWHWTWHGTAV